MRLTQWVDESRDDVKFAARQLWSAPAFTFVAAICPWWLAEVLTTAIHVTASPSAS